MAILNPSTIKINNLTVSTDTAGQIQIDSMNITGIDRDGSTLTFTSLNAPFQNELALVINSAVLRYVRASAADDEAL
jgi:hypothetical protein